MLVRNFFRISCLYLCPNFKNRTQFRWRYAYKLIREWADSLIVLDSTPYLPELTQAHLRSLIRWFASWTRYKRNYRNEFPALKFAVSRERSTPIRTERFRTPSDDGSTISGTVVRFTAPTNWLQAISVQANLPKVWKCPFSPKRSIWSICMGLRLVILWDQVSPWFSAQLIQHSTFAHLPHVKCLIHPEESFDIAVLGCPFDTAVSYRPGNPVLEGFEKRCTLRPKSHSRCVRPTVAFQIFWPENGYQSIYQLG